MTSVSTARMLFRALLPSVISTIICLLVGLMIVAAHTLSLSTSGIAYPTSADDTFMLFYANYVVQPLVTVVNSSFFNTGLTILAWGAAGLLVYILIAGAVGTWSRWRETEQNVSVPKEGVVIRHPLEDSTLVRGVWRFLMLVLAAFCLVAFLPLLRWCLMNDLKLMQSHSIGQAAGLAMLTILTWAGAVHCYLVLLRLFLFRTRVFGELLY